MARKRMFSNSVIDTDKFRDLGQSAQALYFMLGMDTDDEGFVSFKKWQKLSGFQLDDLKVLAAKGFVEVFENGIVVIIDFLVHNYLDKNRSKPTIFQKELHQLTLTADKRYVFNKCLTDVKPEEMRREEMSGDGSLIEKTIKTEEGAEKKTERSEEEIKKMRRENNAILKKVEEELKNIGKMPFAPETVPTVYID